MASSPIAASLLLSLLLLISISSSVAIRPSPDLFNKPTPQLSALLRSFSRAPTPPNSPHHRCSDGGRIIHVAMTLHSNSLRALVSSVGSILSHSSCPHNLRFHFLASPDDGGDTRNNYRALLEFVFPRLSFRISAFEQEAVQALVERKLARDPLSYARGYLADVLPPSVDRVIYLNPNVIVLDDIVNLWNTRLRHNSSVVAAPRYCVARKRCYFKTGVMVVDLGRWREGGYSERVGELMARMRKGEWIYDPMVAAFRGAAEGIDERWDRVEFDLDGDCKVMYGEGEVSLVHWSAVKPWEGFHGEGCEAKLWAQYDLYRS